MNDEQLETLKMMAITGYADMYGGPHSYYCFRNLLIMGHVKETKYRDIVEITEKGRKAVENAE